VKNQQSANKAPFIFVIKITKQHYINKLYKTIFHEKLQPDIIHFADNRYGDRRSGLQQVQNDSAKQPDKRHIAKDCVR